MNFSNDVARLSGLEQLGLMLREGISPGMALTLGIELVAAEDGWVALEAVPDTSHYNPNGVVHGGFAATMLDFACGYVTLSKLEAGSSFTTLELKVSYHRPMTAETGKVRAEGRVVSIGRRAAFVESRLTDEQGKLLASASSSLLLARPG
ncbi:MAG TPA: PaaI family thioesterase [Trueperaceae bacterium]